VDECEGEPPVLTLKGHSLRSSCTLPSLNLRPITRGLQSSTFWLSKIYTFCGIRWVASPLTRQSASEVLQNGSG